MCGTPIGLPGPPSVPLGVPAGLYHHEITNHTHVCLPAPTHAVCIDVKQEPGMTYPKPVDHVTIVERTRAGGQGQCGSRRRPVRRRRRGGMPSGRPTRMTGVQPLGSASRG